MAEPNFWNPLHRAAEWLSQATGQSFDVRGLVDLVAKSGRMGTPSPTIIKAMMPRSARFALLAMPGHPEREALLSDEKHARLSAAFGALPGLAYIQEVRQDVMPLCVNDLLELLMRGEAPVSVMFTARSDEVVFLLPFNSEHMVNIETCGINRVDLVGLAQTILDGRPKPAESIAERDDRWFDVLVEEQKAGGGAMARATRRIERSEGYKADTIKKGIQRARKRADDARAFRGLVR